MENKVSAQELFNVVLDTNEKVTKLTKGGGTVAAKKVPFATRLAKLLTVFGLGLVAGVLFPEARELVGLSFLTPTMWNFGYLCYAVLTLSVVLLSNMKKIFQLPAVLVAIAPIVVSFITTF